MQRYKVTGGKVVETNVKHGTYQLTPGGVREIWPGAGDVYSKLHEAKEIYCDVYRADWEQDGEPVYMIYCLQ